MSSLENMFLFLDYLTERTRRLVHSAMVRAAEHSDQILRSDDPL